MISNRKEPVVVEQELKAGPGEVWEAITNPEIMRKWFFENIPDFSPEVGFQTSFPVSTGDRIFTHLWKIIQVTPGQSISYHWSYSEYPGEGVVTFELEEKDNHTMLRLTNTGLETFPGDIPEFSRSSCMAGWDYFIRKNLNACFE